MAKYYAGIGSRATPKDIKRLMQRISRQLSCYGYTLRSGGAIGADRAFESAYYGEKEIFTPKDVTYRAIQNAKLFHPAWDHVSPYAQLLLARNSQIILGGNLDKPVEFVVCYTPEAREIGGTGQAIRVAKGHNIRVHNLGYPEQVKLIEGILEKHANTCELCGG